MQFWYKNFKMTAKIVNKPPNRTISSEISQSVFLAITIYNIITVLNNNMLYIMCFGT